VLDASARRDLFGDAFVDHYGERIWESREYERISMTGSSALLRDHLT
jgi:hypothetical protein